MAQRSVRFPDTLQARLEEIARAEDRTFSRVVVRTLEKALGGASCGQPGVGPENSDSAPSRAPVDSAAVFACPMGKCRRTADAPIRCPAHPHLTMKPVPA